MTELPDDFQTAPLAEVDPDIARVLERELARQQNTLEMIASENFVPQAVLDAAGSVLTNKYAEGYPGKRYYGGCEYVDEVERLAIERAKRLFGAEHANVQPHSGSNANLAVYLGFLEPGDRILGLSLAEGGHLTHGHAVNYSGRLFEPHFFGVDATTGLIDYDEVAARARDVRPRAIIAGFGRFGQIVGRVLEANGFETSTLDVSVEQITLLKRFDRRVYYGDASRLDLLRAAGAENADVLVVAIDDKEKALEIVKAARQTFPNMQVLARAFDRRLDPGAGASRAVADPASSVSTTAPQHRSSVAATACTALSKPVMDSASARSRSCWIRIESAAGAAPPCCSSLRKMERIRTSAYCKYGPVLPSAASMRSQSKT